MLSSYGGRVSPLIACLCICVLGVSASAQSTPADTAAHDSVKIHTITPVTVTAAAARREQPVGATNVSAEVIRQTPATSTYELLRQTAGLEVHQQGQGPGFASDASLRGFSSDHSTDLALWIDGVPVNEPINGHAEGYNDWTVLFPGGVRDIDVIRGPSSALFGNFALAGVVNVRTLERMKGTEATLTGGSYGRGEGMLLTGFDHGTDGGVLGLRVAHENGFRPNADFDLLQVHGRVVRQVTATIAVDGGIEVLGSRWNSPGFLSEDEFAARQYGIVSNDTDGGYKRRAQERFGVRYLSGADIWRTTAYATQSRWQLFLTVPPAGGRFEGSGSQTEEEDSRQGYGITSALTHEFANAEITVGAEGRLDKSGYQNFFTMVRARDSVASLVDARQITGDVFVQSHVDLTSAFRVDAGMRYDALNTQSTPPGEATVSATHGVVSPKLGAILRVIPEIGVYGNISRGFRSTDGVIRNPTLVPITAWSYEAGLKLDHGPISATAAAFRMDVSNEQTFNPLNGQSSNGGASRRQGVELDLRMPIQRMFALSGNWTFVDARYRSITAVSEEGDANPVTLDGLRVYNTATYVGSGAVDFAPPERPWKLRLSGNWVGRYSPFDEPGETVGGYGLMHASGVIHFGKTEADIGVRNIFNRAYPELIAAHIVSPGQPRSVYATLRLTM
jgi:outer membrane receptor protein involved in Fe transport